MHVLKLSLGDGYPIDGNYLRPGPKPKFTDIEVIALNLTAEYLGINSENHLFHILHSQYKTKFKELISRRQFNDRKKNLFYYTEEIRKVIASKLNEINEVFAIDSMPLELCKLSRMYRNKLGKEHEHTAPDKSYCASQDKFFYGYKLHAVCSPSGVIQTFNLSKASIHDIHYLKDVSDVLSNCIITGDRGYIGKSIKEELFMKSKICLEVPCRNNQKEQTKVLPVLRKIRKRIETVFSQLCGQFKIQQNYAKSFYGYRTRILSKVCTMTIMQYINKFITNKPIGQIKYAMDY